MTKDLKKAGEMGRKDRWLQLHVHFTKHVESELMEKYHSLQDGYM